MSRGLFAGSLALVLGGLSCAGSSSRAPAAMIATPEDKDPVVGPRCEGAFRISSQELRDRRTWVNLARRHMLAARVRGCGEEGVSVLEACSTSARYAWVPASDGPGAGQFRGPRLARSAFAGQGCKEATHLLKTVTVGGQAPCRAHWRPLESCREPLEVELVPLLDPITGPEHIVIEAGRVRLGPRSVAVARFRIDRVEVSIGDWKRCVEAGACSPLPRPESGFRETGRGCPDASSSSEDEPVRCVSYDEAAAYCASVKGRLPSASEWLWAARSPAGSSFVWGEAWPPPARAGNFADLTAAAAAPHWRSSTATDGFPGVHPVDGVGGDRSDAGVRNLAGNVREWVSPVRRGYARVMGASFGEQSREALRLNRVARYRRGIRSAHVGFRCAHDPL